MSDYEDYADEDEAGIAFSGKLWTIIMVGFALVLSASSSLFWLPCFSAAEV